MEGLRALRLKRGLSQHGLAQASGVPRWKIQLLEHGLGPEVPSDRTRLAKCLGTTEAELGACSEDLDLELSRSEAKAVLDAMESINPQTHNFDSEGQKNEFLAARAELAAKLGRGTK